jgi:hypothetical protein
VEARTSLNEGVARSSCSTRCCATLPPSITWPQGGAGSTYTDADWVRAIRHWVDPDGKGLLVMPSEVFQNLGAGDLGAIIPYIKSVPPVDNHVPEPATSRRLGRLMIVLGLFGEMIPAQKVDHDAPFVGMPSPGSTAEYGQYLVSIAGCSSCHGDELTGHQPGDPAYPKAPNIASGSARST